MKLLLERVANKAKANNGGYCIGHLYEIQSNGKKVFLCDTLEDYDRLLTNKMTEEYIKTHKVHGKTAIPTGVYQINMRTYSSRFGRQPFYRDLCLGNVPRVMNVLGYSGVLIHVGNTESDTEGCILVGENKAVGQVINSRVTFTKLYKEMKKGGNISLTITRKY